MTIGLQIELQDSLMYRLSSFLTGEGGQTQLGRYFHEDPALLSSRKKARPFPCSAPVHTWLSLKTDLENCWCLL